MFVTGISDEAAHGLAGQIAAHRELGWTTMELRNIDGIGVARLDAGALSRAADEIHNAGMDVYAVASTIGNWASQVTDPFERTLEDLEATITACKRLGAPRVRIMSYAILAGKSAVEQLPAERIRRLCIVVGRLRDEGLVPLHENCMNYGGMGWRYTLELLEHVPGMELVFDTGNPVFADDRNNEPARGKQSAWEFYEQVRDHVTHVHIKDGVWDDAAQQTLFCHPGEGTGDVGRVVEDLARRGYSGALSIEPHMGHVFHEPGASKPNPALQAAVYREYGRRLEAIVQSALAKT